MPRRCTKPLLLALSEDTALGTRKGSVKEWKREQQVGLRKEVLMLVKWSTCRELEQEKL